LAQLARVPQYIIIISLFFLILLSFSFCSGKWRKWHEGELESIFGVFIGGQSRRCRLDDHERVFRDAWTRDVRLVGRRPEARPLVVVGARGCWHLYTGAGGHAGKRRRGRA
jgi:hypothetical protein